MNTEEQTDVEGDGSIKFRKVVVMGKEFMIDEMFKDEEFERIYLELGICEEEEGDDFPDSYSILLLFAVKETFCFYVSFLTLFPNKTLCYTPLNVSRI